MLNQIVTGDARELAKGIEPESIDLILTDPIYENIDDYRWLGETAMRVLKPDSACLAWSSTPRAAHCQIAMEEAGLDYIYTLNYVVPAKPYRLMHYHLFLWTTPCLLFQKGHALPNRWIPDTVISTAIPTGGFKWNKNTGVIQNWLTAFSSPGNVVFDPFSGGGTVPAICKMTGRNFIAFECVEERAQEARKRLEGHAMLKPTVGTYFSGGGIGLAELKGKVDFAFAVEYDPAISEVYRANIGDRIITARVQDVDVTKLERVDLFQVSPVCKEFSAAKTGGKESAEELSQAAAICRLPGLSQAALLPA
jgi:hypothetical protein